MVMKCPYCDNGVSRYSEPGFNWPCTICNGTGEIMPDEMSDKHTKEKEEDVKVVIPKEAFKDGKLQIFK